MSVRTHTILITSAALALTVPTAVAADPGGQGRGKPVVGAQSLGDPLFPQIGNGGYDVEHYRIDLDYAPQTNTLTSATTTIVARAQAHLKQFSLDFQDLQVSHVMVDGRRANFRQVAATPQLSSNPAVTQPMKLVVNPHPSAWPKPGRTFRVEVKYSGTPTPVTDVDESLEGWIRACYPLQAPQTCDGAFVVNEPIGAQSWFPSNNHPRDKATFYTSIRVPAGVTALGVGESAGTRDNGDGTVTWRWREDHPTATYLTTATVGDFTYTVDSMVESTTGRTLPVYNAVDSSATPAQTSAIDAVLQQAPGQLNFLSGLFGPYPFDSTGAVADRAAGVGYALEVQGKPHYAGGFTTGNPGISLGTQLHEIAHQWFGNSVTLANWSDIWFNEGWANWSQWYWSQQTQGGQDPAARFDALYTDPSADWSIAPAVLDGDPVNLFANFPTYQRGAMTLQGYREIVGDERFFGLARTLNARFAYDTISTSEFIAAAKRASGLRGAQLALLDDYFQQWLYGESRPTILPESFV